MKSTSVRLERCYEPISRCLIRSLIVPKIYFDRSWSSECLPILAVDRSGTGELHVVKLYESLHDALNIGVKEALSIPAHYRWIAFQGEGLTPRNQKDERLLISQKPLFPVEGMGRIGVIEVVMMAGNDLGATIKVKAERFKVTPVINESIDTFVSHEKADIAFKP